MNRLQKSIREQGECGEVEGEGGDEAVSGRARVPQYP